MKKHRLALLALTALLMIASLQLEGASQINIQVEVNPDTVSPGGTANVTTRIYGSVQQGAKAILKIELLRGGVVKWSESRAVVIQPLEWSTYYAAIAIDSDEEPGFLTIRVALSFEGTTIAKEVAVGVVPSLTHVTSLALRLADLDERLDKLVMVNPDDSRVKEIKVKRYKIAEEFGELVRLVVERTNPKKASQLYQNITDALKELNSIVSDLWNLQIVVWSISSELDSSLRMPQGISLEFWYKLITASIWVVILLILLFPLYSTGYLSLTYYLSSEMEESGKFLEEAKERALKILRRAYGQMNDVADLKSMIMVALAGGLATIGLMSDNLAAIIGSMLLSPLMGAIVSGAVGLALVDVREEKRSGLDLFYTGLKIGIQGILLVVIISWFTAFLARSYVPLQMTKELAARGSPNLVDLFIALAAGFAGSLAMMHEKAEAALVGSAIAIALIPPAATVGVAIAMLNPSLLVGSATLTTVNVIALIAAGYLSAKLYAIFPVIEKVFQGLQESLAEISSKTSKTTAEKVLATIGSIVISSIWFLSIWLRVAIGLLGGLSIAQALKSMARRVTFLLLPLLLAWVIGAVVSTNISAYISAVHGGLVSLFDYMSPLTLFFRDFLTADVLLTLALIATAILVRLTLSEGAKARSSGDKGPKVRVAIYSLLLWLVSGYVLGIHKFPHVSAAYSILLFSVILVYSSQFLWARRKKIALYGFIVFTFLTLMIHSAAAFESVRAAETLRTENVVKIVRGVVASYAGVMPEDVNVTLSISADKWVLHAKVYISESRFREGVIMTPSVVKAAEETLREALGVDIKLIVEYAIVP